MRKTGKSLALFPEDELPPVHSSIGAPAHPPALPKDASRPTHSSDDVLANASAITSAPPAPPPLHVPTATRDPLWLSLLFFAFPLEVLCRQPEQATVVVADRNGRPCVVACDQRAYDQGVRIGMALAAAYALVHELDVLPQDEAQEQAVLERLATWAKKYTPMVSLCSQSLLLEVRGSLALFGGIEGIVNGVQHDLRALGFAHRQAVAPTPTAALWLAKHEQGVALDEVALKAQLGPLPIAVTGWPDAILSRLQGMGVRTLRDCLRLPRDGFARRIGKKALLELDRAQGRAPDPRTNYEPPDKFVAKRELLYALESVNRIVRALDALLVELCHFLRGRQSGIQTVRITLYHAHAPASVVHLGTASACRDSERLLSLLTEKIEALTLPEGVVALSMVSGRLYPLVGFDGQLFRDAAHSDVPWPELVEKLRARLGRQAVTGVCLMPEHRPEQAWQYTEPGTTSDVPVLGRRPLWLLAQPHRLRCREREPQWHGPLTFIEGPERIESGWWDGRDAARDYYVVVNTNGLTLWVYRMRTPTRDAAAAEQAVAGNALEAPHWYIHGVFA
ncbi:MAG: DNA polymerase Y family protein [Pseudomonadota bacterium]